MAQTKRKNYWLFKSEPETYSFTQLIQDKKTAWNGVRNFQARNYLKECTVGDEVLIYHSGDSKSVVGIAKIIGAPYAEPDSKRPGDWVQVDISPVQALKREVPLAEIKANSALRGLQLIKQSRLSVMPVSAEHFQILSTLGNSGKPSKASS